MAHMETGRVGGGNGRACPRQELAPRKTSMGLQSALYHSHYQNTKYTLNSYFISVDEHSGNSLLGLLLTMRNSLLSLSEESSCMYVIFKVHVITSPSVVFILVLFLFLQLVFQLFLTIYH